MISTIEAKHVITQGIHVKAADLLILESSTIREIRAAYTQARNEIVQQLRTSWNEYNSGKTFLSPKELKLAGTKLLRDQQLFDNLDARLTQLGGNLDGINGKAILDAAGIQNNFTQKEFEAICKFTNLDPKSFALINHFQAEAAITKVNKGTKFISKVVQKDTLKAMRQQMRIGILKGESIDKITARLVSSTPLTLEGVGKGVFRTIEQRARLNARWGIIESANDSAVTQYGSFNQRLDKAGIKDMQLMKQVIAEIDDRTTETCIYANGQIKKINEDFETAEGNLPYPPFHPNCRTTVGAWHQAFEAYGKNTQAMLKESKAELKKRGKIAAKKKTGKKFTKKQLAKQKALQKAGAKALKATTATGPPEVQMVSKAIQKKVAKIPSKDAAKILETPSNVQREKALAQLAKKPDPRGHLFEGRMDWKMDKKVAQVQQDFLSAGQKISKTRAKEIAKSFEKFTGTDFSRVSAYNRGGEKELAKWLKKTGWDPTKKMTNTIIREAKDIEEYLKYAPKFTEKTKIFRGVQNGKGAYSKLTNGSIIDMQGSTSFSTSMNTAANFSDEATGVIFELKSAPDLSASIKHLAINPGENEVLISSQTRYKVIGKAIRNIDGEKLQIIKLEAIA